MPPKPSGTTSRLHFQPSSTSPQREPLAEFGFSPQHQTGCFSARSCLSRTGRTPPWEGDGSRSSAVLSVTNCTLRPYQRWPPKLPFWQDPPFQFASLPCRSDSQSKELGGLRTSAGAAEATTPAATSIAYTDGLIAPYRTPKGGISTCACTEESPYLAVHSDSPSSAPHPRGTSYLASPINLAQLSSANPQIFFHPVPVSVHDAAQDGFSSLYVQRHLLPKITETSLKITTPLKEAGETGPETQSSKLILR